MHDNTITRIEEQRSDPRETDSRWEDRVKLARRLADRLRDIANCLEEFVEDSSNWPAKRTVIGSLRYGVISIGTEEQLNQILCQE